MSNSNSKFKIGDRVICKAEESLDYNKGGTVNNIILESDVPEYLAVELGRVGWCEVGIDNDDYFLSGDTAYHESELALESTLIKDH